MIITRSCPTSFVLLSYDPKRKLPVDPETESTGVGGLGMLGTGCMQPFSPRFAAAVWVLSWPKRLLNS